MVPDVLADRPVTIIGKWKGTNNGIIELSGYAGNSLYTHKIDVSKTKPYWFNSGLRNLWARQRIKILSDYSSLRGTNFDKEVTELGLKYNLLTKHTSFVAVDKVVRNTAGYSNTSKQPSPLPKGVSNYSVGGGQDLSIHTLDLSMIEESGNTEENTPNNIKAKLKPTFTQKKIGDVILNWIDGAWQDQRHSQQHKLVSIKKGSKAYQQLAKAIPNLDRLANAGDVVIINIGLYSIRLSDKGLSTISDSKLYEILHAEINSKVMKES